MRKSIIFFFLLLGTLRADDLIVGAIYNLTGTQASIDKPALQGFNLAFEQLQNSQNNLLKHLKHVVSDGKTDPEVITEEAKRLYQVNHLLAIMGINDDEMARAVSIEAKEAQKIFISSGATSPLLTKEFPTYTFLVAFGDNAQAAAAAEYATGSLQFQSSIILCNADMEYARLISEYFSESFTKNGGVVVATESYSPQKKIDLQNQIKKIKELQPEMIYLASGPQEINAIIEQLRQAAITLPIMGGDSFDTPLLSDQITDVYYTTHVLLDSNSQDPKVINFIQDYRKHYGKNPDSAFAALGFDACNLFAAALIQAGSERVENLLNALNKIQFKGVTGEIKYVNGNHTPQKPVTLVSLNRGKKIEVAKLIPRHIPEAKRSDIKQ